MLQQRRTALGHHHRIEHQPAKRFTCQLFRYAFNHFGRAEHADFKSGYLKIGGDGVDLRTDNIERHAVDGLHAERVLRGYRRQHAHAVHAAHLKGFQIGLNAGAAAAV